MTPLAGRPRVLIADDETPLLQLLEDFLTGQSYEVAAVATGAEVFDALPTFQPDVIVVDMVMPGPRIYTMCMAASDCPESSKATQYACLRVGEKPEVTRKTRR